MLWNPRATRAESCRLWNPPSIAWAEGNRHWNSSVMGWAEGSRLWNSQATAWEKHGCKPRLQHSVAEGSRLWNPPWTTWAFWARCERTWQQHHKESLQNARETIPLRGCAGAVHAVLLHACVTIWNENRGNTTWSCLYLIIRGSVRLPFPSLLPIICAFTYDVSFTRFTLTFDSTNVDFHLIAQQIICMVFDHFVFFSLTTPQHCPPSSKHQPLTTQINSWLPNPTLPPGILFSSKQQVIEIGNHIES